MTYPKSKIQKMSYIIIISSLVELYLLCCELLSLAQQWVVMTHYTTNYRTSASTMLVNSVSINGYAYLWDKL